MQWAGCQLQYNLYASVDYCANNPNACCLTSSHFYFCISRTHVGYVGISGPNTAANNHMRSAGFK